MPDLANTTWIGTNFEGEQYEVTFHVEGHVGKGFTVKTPTGTIDGFGFYFVGQPEHHGRSGATTCKFAMEFLMNNARLGGEVWADDDQIVFKDVAPLVVAIDYRALFGDAFKPAGDSSDKWLAAQPGFDCAGQKVSAFVVFEADSKRARESFEDGIIYEQDERPPKPGPYGLGEACYYKWAPWPNHVPEMHFIRKNVLFYFPNGNVLATPAVKERIYQVAYILDSAVRDENPAVTVIRMPKTLHKVK